jgi:hypothetical protein
MKEVEKKEVRKQLTVVMTGEEPGTPGNGEVLDAPIAGDGDGDEQTPAESENVHSPSKGESDGRDNIA